MAKDGFKVLDSDLHVNEPHDLYMKYMDPKWGDRIPRAEYWKGLRVFHYYTADGKPVRTSPHKENNHDSQPWKTAQKMSQNEEHRFQVGIDRDFDPVSQVEAMDIEGIDYAVLFRTVPLHTDDSQEPEYAMALCRAWNDWITDFASYAPDRMKAAGLITLHDADLAVEEMRRIVTESNHIAVCMTPEPILGRQLPDPYFDIVWAEAEKLNIPVCFHPSFAPNQVHWANRFASLPDCSWLQSCFDQPMENMLAVAYFTACGILERFPNLKVAFLEGNCSWLPWMLYRLDERYEYAARLGGMTQLSKKPSDYFLEQCFMSIDVDEYLGQDVIRRIGDDNLVFSTDYPHPDSHFPNSTSEFLKLEIPEKSKQKILWDNCARLYNVF